MRAGFFLLACAGAGLFALAGPARGDLIEITAHDGVRAAARRYVLDAVHRFEPQEFASAETELSVVRPPGAGGEPPAASGTLVLASGALLEIRLAPGRDWLLHGAAALFFDAAPENGGGANATLSLRGADGAALGALELWIGHAAQGELGSSLRGLLAVEPVAEVLVEVREGVLGVDDLYLFRSFYKPSPPPIPDAYLVEELSLTTALELNNLGQVLGQGTGGSSSDATPRLLQGAGAAVRVAGAGVAEVTSVADINDRGQIVGRTATSAVLIRNGRGTIIKSDTEDFNYEAGSGDRTHWYPGRINDRGLVIGIRNAWDCYLDTVNSPHIEWRCYFCRGARSATLNGSFWALGAEGDSHQGNRGRQVSTGFADYVNCGAYVGEEYWYDWEPGWDYERRIEIKGYFHPDFPPEHERPQTWWSSRYYRDINEAGWIVGVTWSESGSEHYATIWSGDSAEEPELFGAMFGTASEAFAVNDGCQVVGTYEDGSYPQTGSLRVRGFVWDGQNGIDLDTRIPADAGVHLTQGEFVNDLGQIVARGVRSGQTGAKLFLLTPRPRIAAIRGTQQGVVEVGWEDWGERWVYALEAAEAAAGPWRPVASGAEWPLQGSSWTEPIVAGTGAQFYRLAAAEHDWDCDGVLGDNCPGVGNPDQRDSDADGFGDACDGFPNNPAR